MNKGIIYNQDGDTLLYDVGKLGCTLTAEEMENYASQFKGSHMTDIMLCVNNCCSTFPSKVRTSLVDKYHQKTENGREVDYTNVEVTAAAHHIYEVLGIDHIEVEIRTFRKIGINPWISFRMNDFHHFDRETSFLLSDFFHEHPECRRVKNNPELMLDYGDRAMDYGVPLVREYMLAYIDEALERYDPYGIELDYTREIEVFSDGGELDGLEIMTQFVRDVYAICQKYSAKYKHKIKLAVRVAPEIQQNMDYGLNVIEWVGEGIIDLVTIAGRFLSTDTDMPINLWATLVKPYGVELAAGIEMGVLPHFGRGGFVPDMEICAAFAVNAYSQGADKIYMYNFFQEFQSERIDTVTPNPNDYIGLPQFKAAFYSTLGDSEKALMLERRHIWAVNDRIPKWHRNRAGGTQLPATLTRSAAFKITVGEIPQGAKTSINIGFADIEKASANPPRIFVNSEECTYAGTMETHRAENGTVLCYDVPETAHRSNVFVFIITKDLVTVNYIEAYIKASE